MSSRFASARPSPFMTRCPEEPGGFDHCEIFMAIQVNGHRPGGERSYDTGSDTGKWGNGMPARAARPAIIARPAEVSVLGLAPNSRMQRTSARRDV